MEVKFGNETGIDIDLSGIHGITDVLYMVKDNKTDADIDAKVNKTLLGTDITDNGDGTFLVELLPTDFGTGKLEVDNQYYVAIGVKFTGSTSFIEVDLNDDQIKILQDLSRS